MPPPAGRKNCARSSISLHQRAPDLFGFHYRKPKLPARDLALFFSPKVVRFQAEPFCPAVDQRRLPVELAGDAHHVALKSADQRLQLGGIRRWARFSAAAGGALDPGRRQDRPWKMVDRDPIGVTRK